ncbi:hypothetical protein K8R32_02235, partial [bacterium]|nr:hypothetical protein [bacterium]
SIVLDDLQKYLTRARNKKLRDRTIYLKLRKAHKYDGWSDIVLLNSIVSGLIELDCPYSRNEVYAAFKEVSCEEYDKSEKGAILKNLLTRATKKSVFT